MATAPNTKNKRDSPQAEKNFTAIRYGNDKGSISFGHIHKQGDVTAGALLATPKGDHQLSLDISGPREGWTTSTSPGNFQVKCGFDPEKISKEDGKNISMILLSENGDIVIKAANGSIRMEALNIEMSTTGKGTDIGNIKMTASENIDIKSKKFLVDAKNMFRLVSPMMGQLVGGLVLQTYSGVFYGVTGACSVKNAKNAGQELLKQFTKTSGPATQP
tara:strand:+ start:343 stop:996 length:654 start_codon:yes stop_codon:yes gene_type:complete